ncbi:MAG: DUF86 domain-containing protein [bacterium]
MMKNLPFLKHIHDEAEFLLKETKGFSYEDFVANELLKRGCARSLEVIGEAVKNLSVDFKKRYSVVEWKKLAGMRDKIIHYYFGVNWDIVWATIQEKIPQLKEGIETIIDEIEKDET